MKRIVSVRSLRGLRGCGGARHLGSRRDRRAAQPHRLKPLRLRETCVTRAERRRVLRFTASDRVRLIGVVFGRGPRAVILAHEGNSDLCLWVPYARALAARGYRVLAFDHRGDGSSGRAGSRARRDRVDYDVLGAIRAMRARGATNIVLAGGSLGAAAVLSAAAAGEPSGERRDQPLQPQPVRAHQRAQSGRSAPGAHAVRRDRGGPALHR